MRRLTPFILIAAGFAVIASGALYYVVGTRLASPGAASLPDSLAGLPLASSISGPLAASEITRLHSKSFPLSTASIGRYGTASQITIWAAGVPSPIIASTMLRDMREKIETEEAPFQILGEKLRAGRTVYELSAFGQRHYYYQAGSMLIWLAADGDLAEQALQEVLAYYP